MKRLSLILLLVLSPFATIQAQIDDEIIKSSDDLHFGERPAMEQADSKVSTSFAPSCSSLFLESTFLVGNNNDIGLGISTTIIPYHWGGYGTVSGLFSERYSIYSAGVVYRPNIYPRFVDFQLFSGLSFSNGVGFELGFRLSSTDSVNRNIYSWYSGSFSIINVNHATYYTFGLSLDLAVFFTFLML